jgi:hypothetical protein
MLKQWSHILTIVFKGLKFGIIFSHVLVPPTYFLNDNNLVGFKVLTPVVMMNSIFWDILPCISLEII